MPHLRKHSKLQFWFYGNFAGKSRYKSANYAHSVAYLDKMCDNTNVWEK